MYLDNIWHIAGQLEPEALFERPSHTNELAKHMPAYLKMLVFAEIHLDICFYLS